MVRNIFKTGVLIFLLILSNSTQAQRLSFGEFSGVNFSNPQGNLTSGKWESKAGPAIGLLAEYRLNKSFSIQSGVSYLAHYYELKTVNYPVYYDYPILFSSSTFVALPYNQQSSWDFSFVRFPLLMKYYTPTRLRFGIGAGLYYSSLLNDDVTKEERETANEEGWDIFPPTHDWGYLFVTSLSYPVSNNLRAFVEGRISAGRKTFIENYEAKNGATEVLIGLKYTPRRKDKPSIWESKSLADSVLSKVYLKPQAGIVYSWNASKEKLGNYDGNTGAVAGVTIGYRLGKVVSIQSGAQFVQRGYTMADSSVYYFRYGYNPAIQPDYVDSKVSLDYITTPLNFNFSFGHNVSIYLDLGIYAEFLVNASCQGTAIREHSDEYNYQIKKINLNEAMEGYFESINWGYLTGAGIQIPLRNYTKFEVGINYSGNFGELLKDPDDNNNYVATEEDLSIKNSSISARFGLQIPIPY